MSEELNDIAQIDAYLKGSLEGDDLKNFEKRMQADATFSKEVALQKEIYASIEAYGELQLKKELDGYHQELGETPKNTGVTISKTKTIYIVAASIVTIITFIVLQNYVSPRTELAKESTHTANPSPEKQEKSPILISSDTAIADNSQQVAVVETETIHGERSTPTAPKNEPETIEEMNIIHSFDLQILHAEEMASPSYIFDGKKLWLYGTYMNLQKVEIRRFENKLYLFYRNKYYQLSKSAQLRDLIAHRDIHQLQTLSMGTGKGPRIAIEQTGLVISKTDSDLLFHILEVEDILDHRNTKYKFRNQELIITENLFKKLGSEFDIIHMKKHDNYYLRVNNILYHLDYNTHEFVSLEKEQSDVILNLFKSQNASTSIRFKTLEDNYQLENSH